MRLLSALPMVGLMALTAAPHGARAEESAATEAGIQVGDEAPDFSLPGSDGKTYSLKDFAGERAVVIAWFPKAFTGG